MELVPVSYSAGEKGRVTDVSLVQVLGSSCPGICVLAEAGEVDVNQPIVGPVQHLELVLESTLFKTVPFQIV